MKKLLPVLVAVLMLLNLCTILSSATAEVSTVTDEESFVADYAEDEDGLPETAVVTAPESDATETGSETDAPLLATAGAPEVTEEETAEAETEIAEEEPGLTEKLANWFNDNLSGTLGGELTAFIVSLFPVLECRGGMIVAKLCDINLLKAFFICYIGNMIPVPFILLFIKAIFKFMKKHNILKGFIEKLEGKSEKNRDKILRYKQWGLLIFVAIPLPGTGGWTGSLFASLLNIDFKKALPIVAIGVFIADLIMAVVTYGAGAIFNF